MSTAKTFPLMKLPFELGAKILEYTTSRRTVHLFLPEHDYQWEAQPRSIPLPRAAHAGNKQLRLECLVMFLKTVPLAIHSGYGNDAFNAWLSKIEFCGIETGLKSGFDAVHALEFPHFSCIPYWRLDTNADIELAEKCANLHELSLTFTNEELADGVDPDTGAKVVTTVAWLRQSFCLDELLQLASLELLHIQIATKGIGEASAWIAFNKLKAWFEEEFSRRGQVVEVL